MGKNIRKHLKTFDSIINYKIGYLFILYIILITRKIKDYSFD